MSHSETGETFREGLLHSKVAIVTGVGQPIANAIARRYGKVGARLALVSLPEQQEAAAALATELGAGLVTACEPADPQAVNAVVRRVATELGGVDLLVNANLSRAPGSLEEITSGQWVQAMERQLSGTLYFCKEVIRPMMSKRAGRILNLLDLAPWSASSVVATKGIKAMTRALATEVARHGIYVNALTVNVLPEELDKLTSLQRERIDSKLGPLGRLGTAEEIAEAALFLVSSAANLMTGQPVSVSGGMW